MDNVVLNGLTVNQIGENSLHIKGNSAIGLLIIKDTDNKARVVVEDNASVSNTSVYSGVKLEVGASSNNIKPFSNITIAPEEKTDVVLSGTFDNIKVEKASKVVLDEKTKISNKIDILSTAEIEAKEGAQIAKVDIKATSKEDKVVLSGNLDNVNLSAPVSVEIKAGNIALSSTTNEKVNIKIEDGATVAIPKGKENIATEGKGTVNEKLLNDEANILKVIYTNSGIGEETLWSIPAAIKAGELIDNLAVSSFASIQVIDENDKEVSLEQIVTETMKVRVTSESGKNSNTYSIRLMWVNYPMDIYTSFDQEMYRNRFDVDKNTEKGKLTATVSFQKPQDESAIDGYYLSVVKKVIRKSDENNKYMEFQPLYSVYIPKSQAEELYSYTFKDLDLKGNKILSYMVSPVVNNKIANNWMISAFDNPVNTEELSLEGIVIDEFKDTNLEKGKIEGTISFTKPKDESNVSYYEVVVVKEYINNGGTTEHWSHIGILEPSDFNADLGKYSINIENPVEAGVASEIKILVIPSNEDGWQGRSVSLNILDLPEDKEVKVETPKATENPNENYSLIVSNILEGAEINLYKYDESQNKYVILNDSQHIWGGNRAQIDKLDVGLYKVTQKVNGVETEMSNEVKIRPNRLSGVLQDTTLSLVNAKDGATIKVYDVNGQVIKTLTKEAGKEALVENLNDGVYYITQTLNGIESSRFLVPVGKDYFIEDSIRALVQGINKGNINAQLEGNTIKLSKKSDGAIGELMLDLCAEFGMSMFEAKDSNGNFIDLHKKLYDNTGVGYFGNFKSLVLTLNNNYDSIKEQIQSFKINIRIGEESHIYEVIIS